MRSSNFFFKSSLVFGSHVAARNAAVSLLAAAVQCTQQQQCLGDKWFFEDWQKVMTEEEREKLISDLKKCDFSEIVDHFKQLFQQIRKDGWARKKGKLKEKDPEQDTRQNNEQLAAKHGFCIIDGEKVEIPSYRIYSPGIFHSRQEDLSHALGFPWIKDQIIP